MAIGQLSYFKKPVFLSALICLFIFYSGLFRIPQKNKTVCLIKTSQINEISGTIINSPARTSNGLHYSADFKLEAAESQEGFKASALGRTKIFIPSELAEAFSPGKLYSSAKNDGAYLYESGGSYSFQGRFTDRGFYVTKCKACSWKQTLKGRLQYFRALCRLKFKRLMYGWGSAGGLLLALLCGAREYTADSTQSAFRNGGLSHILALSGMHLSMFSSIAIFFGNDAGVKKLTFILRSVSLLIFVWFAGFSPSLMRAFICTMLSIIAAAAGAKQPDILSILCFSFLLHSAISPWDIYNTGFILSYGALAGILLFSRFFTRLYSKFLPRGFAVSLSSSTGAQSFTLPVSLKIFGSYSPIGIIAASVVSPFITIFIYSGLILIILCLVFPDLSKPSGIFINLQYTVIYYLVKIFSLAPDWSIS